MAKHRRPGYRCIRVRAVTMKLLRSIPLLIGYCLLMAAYWSLVLALGIIYSIEDAMEIDIARQ